MQYINRLFNEALMPRSEARMPSPICKVAFLMSIDGRKFKIGIEHIAEREHLNHKHICGISAFE